MDVYEWMGMGIHSELCKMRRFKKELHNEEQNSKAHCYKKEKKTNMSARELHRSSERCISNKTKKKSKYINTFSNNEISMSH